jgi:integrase
MHWHIALLRRTEVPAASGLSVEFERKPIDGITKADVEALRAARRRAIAHAAATAERCRPGVKQGEVGINRLLARLRHIFTWAIAEGYIGDTPFKRGTVTVVKLETRAESGRTRRLEPGEEERLLQHAGPLVRALIVAALSTGCRVGELLSLQWQQIRRDERGEA